MGKPECNGQCVRIEAFDLASGRYTVRVHSAVSPVMRAKLKREHFDVESPRPVLAEEALTCATMVTSCQASRQDGDFPRNASCRKYGKIEFDLAATETANGGGPVTPERIIAMHSAPAAFKEPTAAKCATPSNSERTTALTAARSSK